MAGESQELQPAPRDPIPFFQDDGVTVRAWLDVGVPWYLRLIGWFLKLAPVPRTLGFYPDGNRRFAKAKSLPIHDGHVKGGAKLEKALAACQVFGIKTVIIMLFTVRNFKRTEEQRRNFFSLLINLANSVCENQEFYKNKGLRVKFIGELEMFPSAVSRKVAEAELATLENSGGMEIVFCVGHSSRILASRMALKICQAVKNEILQPRDVNEELIDGYMDIECAGEVDLVFRTSGENRLSDFLLWQSGYSFLNFEKTFFPDFGLWNIIKAFIHYPTSARILQRVKKNHRIEEARCSGRDAEQVERQQKFFSMVRQDRITYCQHLARGDI